MPLNQGKILLRPCVTYFPSFLSMLVDCNHIHGLSYSFWEEKNRECRKDVLFLVRRYVRVRKKMLWELLSAGSCVDLDWLHLLFHIYDTRSLLVECRSDRQKNHVIHGGQENNLLWHSFSIYFITWNVHLKFYLMTCQLFCLGDPR